MKGWVGLVGWPTADGLSTSVTVRSLLPVHERGTAYHLTFEHLHHYSTRLRNIWNPTSFNCLSPACTACDYMYSDYVRRSRSSSCRLLRPINCQIYITLHYITSGHPSAAGRAQDMESSPVRDRRSTTVPRNQRSCERKIYIWHGTEDVTDKAKTYCLRCNIGCGA